MVKGFLQSAGLIGLMTLSCAAWSADTKVMTHAAPDMSASGSASNASAVPTESIAGNWKMLETYCEECHNSTDWAGKVAFDTMAPEEAATDAEVWEKAVRKMRGSLMPPPGRKQPDEATRAQFIKTMETFLDANGAQHPRAGTVGLHRLNRTEYANEIQEILGLSIDPNGLLPRDDKSDGFDNAADVLKVSPSFLEQYLSAARTVTVEALGNPKARTTSRVFQGPPEANQYVHQEGQPLGTRGGMIIDYDFPADGDYEFTISGLIGAGYLWGVMDPNTLIITIDGDRVFQQKLGGDEDLEAVDVRQAQGVGEINDRFKNIKRHVKAGPHKVGIAYVQKTAAESNEVLHGFVSVAGMGQHVNGDSDGPRIQNVEVRGPIDASGVSDTPSRRKILTCTPKSATEELPCAKAILSTVARKAFRRPIADSDLAGALAFYDQGYKQGGFETGIQKGLMAILVSPKFLYRAHSPPDGAQPGTVFRISDQDLASRLSFFLWSRAPDETLLQLAAQKKLHEPEVLNAQVRRMLADPRAHALVTNFAFQWLNVHGLELVEPDPNLFPDYSADLVGDFSKEMELFIGSVFDSDSSIIDLLTSDRTFVNERLALQYGVKGVRGGAFQQITWDKSYRRGLLGKGAFLMATSYANRTTPVLRGAYILEKFLGTPPASPPPSVQAFVETQEGGVALTVRERLESHRDTPSCKGCHGVIDPLGLALENFNAIGQWRDKDIDAGAAIDAAGSMPDGTRFKGPDDLRNALVARRDQFAQTFTENLMTFALGRGVKFYDMPRVREIVRDSAKQDYRLSAIVLGIVGSEAFQMAEVPKVDDDPAAKKELSAAR